MRRRWAIFIFGDVGRLLGAAVFTAFLAVHGSAANAQTEVGPPKFSLLPLSGRIFSDVYVPTDNSVPDKPLQQASLSVWLESDPKLSENTGLKLVYQGDGFDAQYSNISGNSTVTHLESRLREGYVSTHRGAFDLRAGRTIIVWGKSDVINPTDFHSARNFTFFAPDEEVRRIGSDSAQLAITPDDGNSPWTFTTIWTPQFAQSRLLFPPGLIPPTASVSDPQAPPVTFSNAEISEKVVYNGQGWDASLSYFNGWSHSPELQEVSHALVAPDVVAVNLDQVFRRITAFGADASYATAKWVYRGETAYVITPNDSGDNPLIMPTHWDTVIGAERPLGDLFRAQAQLLFRYFPRYTAPDQVGGADPISAQVNQSVATSNALLLQYQDPTRPGATARLSYVNASQTFDSEIFALVNFNGGDCLLRPRAGYAWTDTLRSELGVELYLGPTNRPLGALHSYTSVFTQTKYTF